MDTMQKHCKALELHKILAQLAEQAVCEEAREQALALRPDTNYRRVERELAETAQTYSLMRRYAMPSLLRMKDCRANLSRAKVGSSLTIREILDIANILRTVRSISDWRKNTVEEDSTLVDWYFAELSPQKSIEEVISNAILSEEEISDHASPALADIRRKIRNTGLRVREQLDRMIKSPALQKFLQDPIVTQRDGRFVVPVKAECRGEVQGFVHATSASGATLFIEPIAVVEANNEVRVLEAKEKLEIERILAEISAMIGEKADLIAESYEVCVRLDLLFAKAKLGYKMKGCTAVLSDNGEIELKQARHPLIDSAKIVPTDISLGVNFDTLVITGPNTGGKTVALKLLGLFTLMTMCGLMIPAEEGSRVSVFRQVLADIGDEQSIEQSLSTFSGHMVNIIEILKEADGETLVLLDELGAGTDPVEGAALAVSIIEELRQKGARVAATTHYPEIKMYALETPGVENACCEFDLQTLRPTYRLLIGMPGRSNALAISERLGMEPEVIERARGRISQENSRFEDVVQKLEESRQLLQSEEEQARLYRVQAEKNKREIEEFKKKLEAEKEKELERARMQAKRMVDSVRDQAEALLDELDDIKKKKDAEDFSRFASEAKVKFRTSMRKLNELADPVTKKNTSEYRLPRPLKRGDLVHITSIDRDGTVMSDPDSEGYVQVQAGILKTKIHKSELRLLDKRDKQITIGTPKTSFRSILSKADREVKMELDLRGQMVEEALLEVDRFIDGAVLSGLKSLTIIHGKGTGALRKAVHAHLKRHPNVKSFRLGVYGEGENGVTVVELK